MKDAQILEVLKQQNKALESMNCQMDSLYNMMKIFDAGTTLLHRKIEDVFDLMNKFEDSLENKET